MGELTRPVTPTSTPCMGEEAGPEAGLQEKEQAAGSPLPTLSPASRSCQHCLSQVLAGGWGAVGGASGQEPCSHLKGQAVPSGGLLGKKAHGGGGWGDRSEEVLGVGLGKGATPTLLISLCRSLVTISSKTSPSPLMSLGMRVGRLSL